MVTIHRGEEEQVIVAEPNRSASWRANLQVLVALSILSLGIAGGFAAVGAWPVLPFAGIEITALGCALYYVSWKLRYRHVITLRPDTLQEGILFFVGRDTGPTVPSKRPDVAFFAHPA